MEAHDEWQVSDRRYPPEASMTELYKMPENSTSRQELDMAEVIDPTLPAAA